MAPCRSWQVAGLAVIGEPLWMSRIVYAKRETQETFSTFAGPDWSRLSSLARVSRSRGGSVHGAVVAAWSPRQPGVPTRYLTLIFVFFLAAAETAVLIRE
jgi:hypothetical protein